MTGSGPPDRERRRRPRARLRWPSPLLGWSPLLAFGVVVAVAMAAGLAALAPLVALGVDPAGSVGTAVSAALTTLAFVGTVWALVVRTGALAWGDMGLARPSRRALADMAAGTLLAVPLVVVELVIMVLLVAVAGTPSSPLPPASSAPEAALDLLVAAVLAPIGEEVFFRGYATSVWARSAGPGRAIARGALFFAFAHIATLLATTSSTGLAAAVGQFLALVPAGLVLGWVFLTRRSLWASIGLHGAYNGLIVLIAFAGATRG